MKKAIFVGTSTIVGVVGVLSYTPPAPDMGAMALPSTPTPTSQPSATATTTTDTAQPTPQQTTTPSKATAKTPSKTQTSPATKAPAQTPAQTTAPTPSQPAGVSGTFDGSTSQTRYGPVQVRIVVQDGKITAASALQYPTRDSRSMSISQQAVPWLVNQTLKAQSAQVDGVGGATYTTNGWISSLANAISKAGL